MDDLLKKIYNIGIMPVIALDDPKDAVPLAKALVKGGIPLAEVTFRTDAALESMKRISAEVPEMLVCAGTVLTPENVDKSAAAGAKLIVTPGLNVNVVKRAQEIGVPIIPGTSNASDLNTAVELGLKTVKFFPAEISGGVKAIKALAAPYTMLNFIPTGGVNASNISSYLSYNRILACGGTWMIKQDLIAEGRFDEITKLAEQAVLAMLDFRVEGAENGVVTVSTNRLERAEQYLSDHGVAQSDAVNLIQR